MQPPFLCQISLFAFNFAPAGWVPCEGQLLPISQDTPYYFLLGGAYGGDGQTSFALPDYRGLAPEGMQYCIALEGVWPQASGGTPTIGELALLPYQQQQLVPNGWMPCTHQQLSVADNETLFEVIGATFGGDGATTFALPDLTAWPPPPSPLAGEGSSLYCISLNGNFEAPAAIVGTVQLFPFEMQFGDWIACKGQLESIASLPALYSVIGNMFGGDGRTTFAVPDLRQQAVPAGTEYRICCASAPSPVTPG
jgi:microcystin-dependent protein